MDTTTETTVYTVSPDAHGDPTLWRGTREDPYVHAVAMKCELDYLNPVLWPTLVAALVKPQLAGIEREQAAVDAVRRGMDDAALDRHDDQRWIRATRTIRAVSHYLPGVGPIGLIEGKALGTAVIAALDSNPPPFKVGQKVRNKRSGEVFVVTAPPAQWLDYYYEPVQDDGPEGIEWQDAAGGEDDR